MFGSCLVKTSMVEVIVEALEYLLRISFWKKKKIEVRRV